MATKDQVRPPDLAATGDGKGKLYLFSDLADGPTTAHLDQRDLDALRAVADWTRTFIIQPNRELGRSGPICPFTPVALEHDALWLALEHMRGAGMAGMVERIEAYNWRLRANAPVDGLVAGYKAIVVIFADLPASEARAFFEALLPPIALPFYERDGLVIGPFYEGNDGGAIYNPQFHPFTSPVPALLMRRAVVSDWKFFLNNPEWFEAWARTHGQVATHALAAELRRLPWNGREQTAKLNPVAADDESDFTFFQIFPADKAVNVSIACELVDRIAGEKLGEPRRLQFLSDHSDLFSSAAARRLSAHGFSETIMLDQSDFPELQLELETQHD